MLTTELLNEIENGQGESLNVAARRIPSARQGKAVTLSCLLRWVFNGVKGPGGERIKLEAARVAGRWVTTPAAIRRFIERQTPRLDGEPAPPLIRSASKRQRASEKAAKALEKLGI
jgi:hypothetical protein